MPYPWSAGNVLTATDLNSTLAAKSDTAPAINAQTGTTYTFVLADATAGKTITASNASASTYTVPPQSSVAFSAGALLRVTNLGAGVVTFAGGVGVTVTNAAGTLSQYQTATLVRTASDAWSVIPFGTPSGFTLIASAALSGATVNINSVFSSTYDFYMLLIRGVTAANVNATLNFRVSGVTDSSANYARQFLNLSAGTGASTGATSMTIGATGTVEYFQQYFIDAPNLSQWTQVMGWARESANNGQFNGGGFNATTVFDGVSLSVPATTWSSGNAAVYGYRK